MWGIQEIKVGSERVNLFSLSKKTKNGNSGNSTRAISPTRAGDVRQRIFIFFGLIGPTKSPGPARN